MLISSNMSAGTLRTGKNVIITRMILTRQEVEHIADLARLELSDQELDRFREQLSAILDYAARLAESGYFRNSTDIQCTAGPECFTKG